MSSSVYTEPQIKCRFCTSIIGVGSKTLRRYRICANCVQGKTEEELSVDISDEVLKWVKISGKYAMCMNCTKRYDLVNRLCMQCYKMCTHKECNKRAGDTGLCPTHDQSTIETAS